MELQDTVCNLEQAKRLKELGVLGSIYIWIVTICEPSSTILAKADGDIKSNEYSAFSVAELGVMLPMQVTSGKYDLKGGYGVSVISPLCFAMDDAEDAGNKFNWGRYATEAEARAAMLIYLLENNLVTPAEINQRLTQK